MNCTYIHTRVLNNSGHAATMLRDLPQKNYDCILSYLLMAGLLYSPDSGLDTDPRYWNSGESRPQISNKR